jgi:uncharacterized DUF497 family protein
MTLQANGFDWDKGNRAKYEKHGLSTSVVESLFTRPLAILPDAVHPQRERRFRAIAACVESPKRPLAHARGSIAPMR